MMRRQCLQPHRRSRRSAAALLVGALLVPASGVHAVEPDEISDEAREVRDRLMAGDSDDQVRSDIVARCGPIVRLTTLAPLE